jgi:hypothetical protein
MNAVEIEEAVSALADRGYADRGHKSGRSYSRTSISPA